MAKLETASPASPATSQVQPEKKARKKPERIPIDSGVQVLAGIMRKFTLLSPAEIQFVLSALNSRYPNGYNGN